MSAGDTCRPVYRQFPFFYFLRFRNGLRAHESLSDTICLPFRFYNKKSMLNLKLQEYGSSGHRQGDFREDAFGIRDFRGKGGTALPGTGGLVRKGMA